MCTDERYLLGAILALSSAVKHFRHSDPYLIYFGTELPERQVRTIQDGLNFRFVHANSLLAAIGTLPAISYFGGGAVYGRLLLDRFLDPSCATALYVDSDTITVSELDRIAPPRVGAIIRATREPSSPTVSDSSGLINYDKYGLDPDAPYFNSGVLFYELNE